MPNNTAVSDSEQRRPESVRSVSAAAATSEHFDWQARYTWSPEVRIKEHDDSSIVLGIGHPRAQLLQYAPAQALEILQSFQQPASLGTALEKFGADRSVWKSILSQLIMTELLVPHPHPQPNTMTRFGPEYLALTAQFGHSVAQRVVTARSDALITVVGSGILSEMLVAILSQAGIGHVYQQQFAGGPATRSSFIGALPSDELLHRSRNTRRYKPAPQQRATVTAVIATGMNLRSRAAALVSDHVPHLIVSANATRSVIGPFVLPGCNACRNCLDLHHGAVDKYASDDDHNEKPIPIPILSTYHTAVAAALELLTFVDGQTRPKTFGGELVQHNASMRVVYQPGGVHPRCACRLLARD